jgi:hypothetical protein
MSLQHNSALSFSDVNRGIRITAGNVGIGTTSPSDSLHIRTATVDANIASVVQNGSRQYRIGIRGDSGNVFAIQDDTASAIRMVINTSGNIGIGTGTPGYRLDVSGQMRVNYSSFGGIVVEGSSQDISLQLSNTSSGGRNYLVGAGGSLSGSPSNFYIYDLTAGAFRMNIGSTGNLGIGEANPSYRLDVTNTSAFCMRMHSTNVDGPVIRFENNASGGRTFHVGSTATGSGAGVGFGIYDVAAGSRLLIDANGNVGMGTISPGARLDVSGTGAFRQIANYDRVLTLQGRNVGVSGTADAIVQEMIHFRRNFTSGVQNNIGAAIAIGSRNANIESPTSMIFRVADMPTSANNWGLDGADIMTLVGNGNVGIGLSNPEFKLDVFSSNSSFAVREGYVAGFHTQWNLSGGQGETDFYNYRGGGTGGFWFKNKNTSNADVGWASIHSGWLYPTGMTSSGGIDVAGESNFSGILNARKSIGYNVDGSRICAIFGGATDDKNFNQVSAFAFKHYTNGGAGTDGFMTIAGYRASNYGSTFYNTAGSFTDYLAIAGNGNVGIGTNTPVYRLHVNSDILANGWIRTTGDTGLWSDTYNRGIRAALSGDYGTVETHGGGKNTWEGYSIDGRYVFMSESNANCGIYNDVDNQWILFYDRASGCLDLRHSDTVRLKTISSGVYVNGNLGIGTETPVAKLHVNGNTWLNNASGDSTVRALGTTISTAPGADYTVGGDPGDSIRTVSLITKGGTRPTILCFRNMDAGSAGFWDMIADPKTSGFYLQNSNGTIPFMANATGSVGLGTTSPQQRLHVNGGRIRIDDPNNAVLELKTNSYYSYIFTESDGNLKLYPSSTSNHIILNPAGAGANVGIGTTPSARLHIYEATGTAHGANAGSIIIDHDNNGGASSITFRSKVNRGSDYGYIQYQDASSVGAGGEANRLILGTQNDGDDHIILSPAGNVGIGTNDPGFKLQVAGDIHSNWVRTEGQTGWFSQTYQGGWYMTDTTWIKNYNGKPLNITGSVYSEYDPYFFIDGPGVTNPGYQGGYFSAYFSNAIQASQLWSTSDARIKTNVYDISDPNSLNILRQLQPKTFSFIYDKKPGGELRTNYGFIAQEVETVLPDAVTKTADFVPSIFETCDVMKQMDQNNQCIGTEITLATKTIPETWSVGTIVRIHKSNSSYQDVKVLSLDTITNKFVVEEELDDPRYFVYGEQIHDFRILHKDVIFAITTAAVQEIDRQLQDERSKTADLESQIGTLQQQYQDLLTRITNLESK